MNSVAFTSPGMGVSLHFSISCSLL